MTYDARQYASGQTVETSKHSYLWVGEPGGTKFCVGSLPPHGRVLTRDSLQVAQIAEMSPPSRVEVLAGCDSCGVVVSVEQLVHQSGQLLVRSDAGAIARRGWRLVRDHQGQWKGARQAEDRGCESLRQPPRGPSRPPSPRSRSSLARTPPPPCRSQRARSRPCYVTRRSAPALAESRRREMPPQASRARGRGAGRRHRSVRSDGDPGTNSLLSAAAKRASVQPFATSTRYSTVAMRGGMRLLPATRRLHSSAEAHKHPIGISSPPVSMRSPGHLELEQRAGARGRGGS